MSDYNKIWESDEIRAMDILGQSSKVTRTIDDHLVIEMPIEVWRKMLNVAEGYVPCGSDWSPFGVKVVCRFVRTEEGRK